MKPFVQKTIDAIVKGARTEQIGDGKIFVLDFQELSESGRWKRVKLQSARPRHNSTKMRPEREYLCSFSGLFLFYQTIIGAYGLSYGRLKTVDF